MSLESCDLPERRSVDELLKEIFDFVSREKHAEAMQVFREWRADELQYLGLTESFDNKTRTTEIQRVSDKDTEISHPLESVNYYIQCANIHAVIGNELPKKNAIACAQAIAERYTLETHCADELDRVKRSMDERNVPGPSFE